MAEDADQPLSLLKRAIWVVLLGSFFFLVYGTCNYLTSLRSSVGSFSWSWEQRIPFVPSMIVPYMSLDLFFAGAILLCRRNELRTHARRVVGAISIAAVCFLLFPLRVGFVKPATAGFYGLLFDWLKFDQPFNQAPSLHIALRSIVWAPFGRRIHGPLRWALIVWFILIGASVLLTYQHQMIDVIGGEILTVIVFYLFPSKVEASTPRIRMHLRGTLVYGVAALLLIGIAILLRPWGLLLLWPACSLALVAVAYAGAGPRIFRKSRGIHSRTALLVLGPYLLGARISRAFLHRSSEPWSELTPNILIGRRLRVREARQLIGSGVTAVLDLMPESRETHLLRGLKYKNVQILDWTVAGEQQLADAIAFIKEHSNSGRVYVHCVLGVSRSAGVLAAYLLEASLAATTEEAIAKIRMVRPRVSVSSGWMPLLRKFERPKVEAQAVVE